MGPATPHASCEFNVPCQLTTPAPVGAGAQHSVFPEPAGPHSPEAAGLARQELTRLAELLGQAATLAAEAVPPAVRAPPRLASPRHPTAHPPEVSCQVVMCRSPHRLSWVLAPPTHGLWLLC